MENTRANFAATSPLEELTHDKDLWLEDGTVVLVARKTAFKVYKGLLSAHSPVFSDMFSSATYADETYDGCPVVRVSDSPEDLKWLLTHLIPKSLPHMKRDHYFTYPEVSALTRLAHKYQIDVVERHAIRCLKDEFMNDFEAWEREVYNFTDSTLTTYNPIDVIYLARLTNTPSILPIAFYLCAQESDILIDGQQREDGTHLVLDKADAKRCLAGFGELWRMAEPMLQLTFLAPTSKSCKTPAECKRAMERMLKRLSKEKSLNHLATWQPHIEKGFRGCTACMDTVIARERVERCELWKKLPQIFGLQDEVKGHWPGY